MGVEGTSNGDGTECAEAVQSFKSEAVNNGVAFEIVHDSGDGSSGASKGFRTYKRRKHAKSSSERNVQEDGRASGEAASQLADQSVKEPWNILRDNNSYESVRLPGTKCHPFLNGSNDYSQRHWRNVLLEQMYWTLRDDEGGIRGCIQDALMFHPEPDCTTSVKESDIGDQDRHKCASQTSWLPNGTSDAGHVPIISNGPSNVSNHHTMTEMCQRAFFNILISEKFTSLCKLLFENFQGIKADSFFDISLINSRMKEGAYESSPMLFSADVHQVWRKLQGIGAEIISLANSLSEISKSSFNEQVEGSVHCTLSEGKYEQTEACGVYKVCICRHCGDKAEGRDCLVCDSCEEMYHVSCIEPAVKEIPPKSWYCVVCTASGIGSPHDNCVVCERLNAPRTIINQDGNGITPTNEETLSGFEENSNCSMDDGLQLSRGSKNLCLCKFCGNEVENGEQLKICDHPFCPNRYFHVRCLTPKQLRSHGPQWYCPSCLCRNCLIDKDDAKIVLCDGCDHAYHIYCMKPPRTSIPKGQWFCKKCSAGMREIVRARMAYEKFKINQEKKGEEDIRAYEVKLNVKGKEESDKAIGGMDMLLNAVNTLNNEEKLAALHMKS